MISMLIRLSFAAFCLLAAIAPAVLAQEAPNDLVAGDLVAGDPPAAAPEMSYEDALPYDPLPSADELRSLGDWANGQRTFIDDYGVYYMTQADYDAMLAERQALRHSFAEADKMMEPAREQARNKLQGYALGLAVMGLVFCCKCGNWFGRVLILAIFLAGAAWLYDLSESKPAAPEEYEPARITFSQ